MYFEDFSNWELWTENCKWCAECEANWPEKCAGMLERYREAVRVYGLFNVPRWYVYPW